MHSKILALTSLLGLTSAKVINIAVGQNASLKFVPDSVTADVGDMLEFHFYNGSAGTVGHSVVTGPYDSPCAPSTNGTVFSGYIPGNNMGDDTYIVKVNDTNPIWYYCSYKKHCENGMVGVVNPPSGNTVQDYASKAKNVSMATAPASPVGGALTTISSYDGTAPATSAATSMSSGGSMAATMTSRMSSGTTAATGSGSASSTARSGAGKGEISALVAMGAVLGGMAALMA